MVPHAASLRPVPKMNPKKAPNAASREFWRGFLFTTNSAMRAPMKEPAIIPKGGKKTIPATIPAIEYLTASFDPPVILVKYGCTT